ncbi:MAG: diguanylate cyclase [Devosia sp.]
MTLSIGQILVANLSVVAIFVLLWAHAGYWLKSMPRPYRDILFALVVGFGVIASMSMALELKPGFFFDLRYSVLAVVAFFGGWPATLIGVAIASGYRLLMGGDGLTAGLAGIALASATGLAGSALVGQRARKTWHIVALALATGAATALAILSLPAGVLGQALPVMLGNSFILNGLATFCAGLVFQKAQRHSAERELLAAALAHAPDFAYVKDANGRFAAANRAVAQLFGVGDPKQLVGKDNFDVEPFETAQIQLEREHIILTTGEPTLDVEEQVTDSAGDVHWYATSKVPLHDQSGKIIGLAGVSRDITAEKQIQQELIRSRDTLSYALSEMTGGLAMYGSDGRLIFCNDQYREGFPKTGPMHQPGAHIRDILRAVIETGEQPSAPRDVAAASEWIDARVANLQRESEDEIELANGRWLQVRTRPTSNGTTIVVAMDVTGFKQAEAELHSTTNELKHLVRTDGLTGLLNRRAFDDAIEGEIRRTGRAGTPLSLLLVDVDRFKPYNDHYGHLAGDEALRQVSQLLQKSLKRPSDVVARFGGEEFTAILPDTDEDGAYLVAEGFRRALAEARLPHMASDKGYLTASVGVATYTADVVERSAVALIETADGALYSAKATGRDRVFGTRVADKNRRLANS